ncbi:MAG: glycosyltransferase family 1 protein [Planctomycetaceae bacterium]|nr:glycosyltransferase family 1 protein [Planctomycetaceae bacterium]
MSNASKQLIVFSDDWGRHPSSCQHLVKHLLNDCTTTWVNTIGTRAPRLDWTTVQRGFEKIWQWQSGQSDTDDSANAQGPKPDVLRPIMWPSFQNRWQRGLNQRLLARSLSQQIKNLSNSVILTTIPIVADLVGHIPARRWVYYCVDDLSAWPGLDGKSLGVMEQELAKNADRIVAAGDQLADRMTDFGRESTIITHGVDTTFWDQSSNEIKEPAVFAELPRPRFLFWGLIDQRLDTSWLDRLAGQLNGGSIILVGPEQDPSDSLDSIPNIFRLGKFPFDELPHLAAAADVLIMPYADLPVTRAMQPLKLKEYMATGKPVVVSNLPAIAGWKDCVDCVSSADDFAKIALQRSTSGLPPEQNQARQRLQLESWSAKAQTLRDILFEDSFQ